MSPPVDSHTALVGNGGLEGPNVLLPLPFKPGPPPPLLLRTDGGGGGLNDRYYILLPYL